MPPTLPSQRATNRNLHSYKGPEDYVESVDEAINDIFLPVLFGQTEQLPEELRELFTLPPAQGGLDIPDMKAEAPQQYAASKYPTNQKPAITHRDEIYFIDFWRENLSMYRINQ